MRFQELDQILMNRIFPRGATALVQHRDVMAKRLGMEGIPPLEPFQGESQRSF
jgi:hypothetical protein